MMSPAVQNGCATSDPASNTFAHHNLLHSERLGTFIQAGWPHATQSFLYLCNPQRLAQAGLEYYAHGEARCVVCFCIVKDLEPTSDPWICHANTNAECPLILKGKPSKADDYSYKEFLDLVLQRRLHFLEAEYQRRKKETVQRLAAVVRAQVRLQKNNPGTEADQSASSSSLASSYTDVSDNELD